MYQCRKTDQNVFWDKNCLCCRQRNILQDYNLELEDIIHDLCGLVGGAMDLTTPRCQVRFPLAPFTTSQWRRFGIPSGGFLPTKIRLFMTTSQWRRFGIPSGVFFPTKIRLLSYLHGILLSHNPNWARRDDERSIWAISLTNTPRKK